MFIRELLYKTKGLILKKEDSGDTDVILTVLTEKKGKIFVRARGIRKKESKLCGFCEPFSFCDFLLARGRGFADILAGAQDIQNFSGIKSDIQKTAVGFYILEVLDKLVVAPQGDPELWDFVIKVMQTLDLKKYEAKKVKIAFERRLLEILGYGSEYNSPINKIQALAGEAIKSYKFLGECL